MAQKPSIPKGTRDFGPAEMAGRNYIFDTIRSEFFHESNDFDILSAGMSDDYMTAIENGSTHVRIGSDIFGPR